MAETIPKRTHYYGHRTTDPATPEAGAWWYRSDLQCWKWYDGTSINYLPLRDQTVSTEFMIDTGGGCASGDVTATLLASIVFVVHCEVVKVVPPQCDVYTPIHWSVAANVIGITVGTASSVAGTTVTVESLFLGHNSY